MIEKKVINLSIIYRGTDVWVYIDEEAKVYQDSRNSPHMTKNYIKSKSSRQTCFKWCQVDKRETSYLICTYTLNSKIMWKLSKHFESLSLMWLITKHQATRICLDIKGANLKGKKSEAVYSDFDIASQQHVDLTESQRKAEK